MVAVEEDEEEEEEEGVGSVQEVDQGGISTLRPRLLGLGRARLETFTSAPACS